MTKITVKIEGMKCPMCEAHTNECVKSNFKVKSVESSHKDNETVIITDNSIDHALLQSTIEEKTGYKVLEIFEEKGGGLVQFRHEVKHEISQFDRLILRQRLRIVMKSDSNAVNENGRYQIRSLYLDTLEDKAVKEKKDSINVREKYRIRFYNHDLSKIHLERKFKQGGIGYKEITSLTPQQAQGIADGDFTWMSKSTDEIIQKFYICIRNEGWKPKIIVDYTREAFVFEAGNVRVTIDSNIRTSMNSREFLNPNCVTIPLQDTPCILEVKWDNYLPDVIRDVVQLDGRPSVAFSKYVACRMYE